MKPRMLAHDVTGNGLDGPEDSERVTVEVIDRVGLPPFALALPRELSGGRPPVLLLAEPFSALDAFTRIDLQTYLLEVWALEPVDVPARHL